MNIRALLRILYVIFSYLLLPLIFFHLAYKGFSDRDYFKRIGERFGFNGNPLAESIVWVHAVSYGEVKAASILITELKRKYPEKKLLITTYTPTGSSLVKELFGNEVYHVYLPYDLAGSMIRFFKWAKPEILIIIETELWPNLFHYCGQFNVPLVLASACVSDQSIKLYKILLGLFQEAVSHGIVVGAQTEEDAKKFLLMGSDEARTFVTGNIKFDYHIPENLIDRANLFKQSLTYSRPIWVAGSTHSKEEEVILDAHRGILENYPDLLLIIAPRRPERFHAVNNLIAKKGFSYMKRSEQDEMKLDDVQVLLADVLGELPIYYSVSNVSFVGGSLFHVGGHNLLEPASLNCPVITGPVLFGVEDIANMLLANDALKIVHNSDELSDLVSLLLSDENMQKSMIKGASDVIEANKGSLEKLLKMMEPLLEN